MIIEKDDVVMTFTSPQEFSAWLSKNHTTAPSIWIRMYKKASGKTGINYDQALDEALCYGWIDGIVKKYDDESYVQRFTPRRIKSNWSKINTEHVARLIKEGRMQPSGMAEVEKAKKDGRWEAAYASPVNAVIPEDFLKEIAKNKKAETFFASLNKTNRYFIAYQLQTAKKPETRERRKQSILKKLELGKKFY